MSFYTNNLEPILDTLNIYNSNVQLIEDYQLTQNYQDSKDNLIIKTYNENLKIICNNILNHFTNINNDINTVTYKKPLIININTLQQEDINNLLLVLKNKGYTPLLIKENGQIKLQI